MERALNQRRPYFGTAQSLVRALVRLVFLTIREEESQAPSKHEIMNPIYLPHLKLNKPCLINSGQQFFISA